MKFGWILVTVIWVIPAGSLLACPYDLHGVSTCSSVAQFGRGLSFYLVAPGLWFGSGISGALSVNPHAGASFPSIVLGVTCWLALLSVITLQVAKSFASRARR